MSERALRRYRGPSVLLWSWSISVVGIFATTIGGPARADDSVRAAATQFPFEATNYWGSPFQTIDHATDPSCTSIVPVADSRELDERGIVVNENKLRPTCDFTEYHAARF